MPLTPSQRAARRDPRLAFVGARVRASAGQSIPDNATTILTWNTVEYDTSAFWDASLSTRFTIMVPGYYALGCCVPFAASVDGTLRRAEILLNGATILARTAVYPADILCTVLVATEYQLALGDYIETRVFQRNTTPAAVLTQVIGKMPNQWLHLLN